MCYSILVQNDLKVLQNKYGVAIVRSQMDHLESMALQNPKKYWSAIKDRIYPNYFAFNICMKDGKRWAIPMRYRLRPAGSRDEVPAKFNVFNARLDSLTTKKTWKNVFGRNHGLIVLREFFEWVSVTSADVDSFDDTPLSKNQNPQNRKHVISIYPKEKQELLVPTVWDWWTNEDRSESFFSFAVITKDPPNDVLAAGHDRCPIILNEEDARKWLRPANSSLDEQIEILKDSKFPAFTFKIANS